MSRTAVEHAVLSTPPLCMFRHALWGASRHFLRNLPEGARAGGQVTFEGDQGRGDPMYTWMGETTKIPTDVEFPPAMIRHIMGEGKPQALLSGIPPATRQRYLSTWNQWAYFMRMRDRPVRLVKTHPNWGEDLVEFVMFGYHVMENKGGTIRVKLSSVEFWHVIAGLGDFAKFGGSLVASTQRNEARS